MGCGASSDGSALGGTTNTASAVSPQKVPIASSGAKRKPSAADVAGALADEGIKSRGSAAQGGGSQAAALAMDTEDTLNDVEVYGDVLKEMEELEDVVGIAAATAVMEVLDDVSDAAHELVGALEHLPMVGAAFSILSVIINRAKCVQVNNHNCQKLMGLVASAKTVLKAVLAQGSVTALTPVKLEKADMKKLCQLLTRASALIKGYTDDGWLRLMLTAPRAQRRFVQLSDLLAQSLEHIKLQLQLQVATQPHPTAADYNAQMLDAQKEVLALTKQSDVATGLKMLASDPTPDRREALAKLLAHGGHGMGLGAIMETLSKAEQLLGQIAAKVDAIDSKQDIQLDKLDKLNSKLDQLLIKRSAAETPNAMPTFLQEWWNASIGKLEANIDNADFLKRVVEWFEASGLNADLVAYDTSLHKKGLRDLLAHQFRVDKHVFIQVVLIKKLLDADQDGIVTQEELRQLLITASAFSAKRVDQALPKSFSDMCDCIFTGFDWRNYKASLQVVAMAKSAINVITLGMKVVDVINSYNTAALVGEYREGSRQWMYDAVNAWLCLGSTVDTSSDLADGQHLLEQHGAQGSNSSRMFLMLADAGMGKSVFSAVMTINLVVHSNTESNMLMVRHFFKVGQARASGKVMLLCLAQQLAEQLPGFADLLLPVVHEHKAASELSLTDTFGLYLLQPLEKLDQSPGNTPGARARPDLLLVLLDALDEADDGGRGWQPVTYLIANEFVKLPVWVKVMLTGRPEVQPAFTAWKPQWIKPDDKRNTADMLEVLRWRLQKQGCVAPHELEAAAQLMGAKSQGQFIYIKYAFEDLGQAVWSVKDLQAQLPDGLSSMFKRVSEELDQALQEDGRLDLLELLHGSILPVLVVSRSPMTVAELAWATDVELSQVNTVVLLLGNLFPSRAVSGSCRAADQQCGVIRPYHKSVLDWLTSSAAGPLKVDEQAGHRVWDLATGQCISTLHLHTLTVRSVAISQDGSTIVSGSQDKTLRVWDLASGQCKSTLEGHTGSVVSVCITPDGTTIVSGSHDRTVRVWDLASSQGRSKLKGHTRSVCCTAVTADGTTLVSGSGDNTLRVWNFISGQCKVTLKGHTNELLSVAVSPDDTTVVSGSYDETMRVWDLASGQCKHILEGHTGPVSCVAITWDGTSIVSCSTDKTIR